MAGTEDYVYDYDNYYTDDDYHGYDQSNNKDLNVTEATETNRTTISDWLGRLANIFKGDEAKEEVDVTNSNETSELGTGIDQDPDLAGNSTEAAATVTAFTIVDSSNTTALEVGNSTEAESSTAVPNSGENSLWPIILVAALVLLVLGSLALHCLYKRKKEQSPRRQSSVDPTEKAMPLLERPN